MAEYFYFLQSGRSELRIPKTQLIAERIDRWSVSARGTKIQYPASVS